MRDDLWAIVAVEKREILCLECIEKRLGREIKIEDLKDCGLKRAMILGIAIWSRQTGGLEYTGVLKE